MISFFYDSARYLKRKKVCLWSIFYKFGKLFLNLVYPIVCMFYKHTGVNSDSNIIISLTSYPERIDTVYITINSLLNQTMKPKKVILWLAKELFFNCALPKQLLKLKQRGLEIKFCDDIRSHKKYFYVIQQFPSDYVITADDDILYPENHVEKLWNAHLLYPDCIICNWTHKISWIDISHKVPYYEWECISSCKPEYNLLAIGCNGILYPPNVLPQETFKIDKVKEIAPYTDDLWLKCMTLLNGKKVYNYNEEQLIYFSLLKTKKNGLWKKNLLVDGYNDKSWDKILKNYPEISSIIIKDNL